MKRNTPSNKCIVNRNFGASKEVVSPIGKVVAPGASRKTTKPIPGYRY